MTQGITGSYAVNGTNITIQPTSGQWRARDLLGIDGNGHPVYSPYRQFEMTWGLANSDEADELQTFFASLGNTGTAVVDLPKYADATYQFYSYTGCIIQEPEWGVYFAEHYTDVTLLITKIKT
jgi:hypothetical protein